MTKVHLLLALAACLPLGAQSFAKLPSWARPVAEASARETPPRDAEAWVLLNRVEVTYGGNGELRAHIFRLVRILGEKGIDEGTSWNWLVGGGADRIVSLKGWNLRPDGALETVGKGDLVTFDPDQPGEVSTNIVAKVRLPRVAKGSLVAFEFEEAVRLAAGPARSFGPVENIPVRRWELVRGEGGLFSPDHKAVPIRMEDRHWADWGLRPEPIPGGLAASGVSPFADLEGGLPAFVNFLPQVAVSFLDPAAQGVADVSNWDGIAKWCEAQFRPGLQPSGKVPLGGLRKVEGLRALRAWMARELEYKSVYLTPGRGWVPLPGAEVVRRRNGDCKDHASCFLAEASGLGYQGFPVLCHIMEGAVEADQAVTPYCFNHAIAALKLDQSLGFASEVETPMGRFLLVDTTNRFCPLGYLPSDHRGRRVLICTPAGGLWVTVPEAATLEPRVSFQLTGKAAVDGALTSRVLVREQGNALSLRATALWSGREGLRRALLDGPLQLPSSGTLDVLTASDPLDLDHPFCVEVSLTAPDGFARVGENWSLAPWGLPATPPPIQKAGRPRQGPVLSRRRGAWELVADWELPATAQSRLPALQVANAFRTLTWTARTTDRHLHLDFHEETQDAEFPMARREEGAAQWKKDRNLMERLRMDGCTCGPATPAGTGAAR